MSPFFQLDRRKMVCRISGKLERGLNHAGFTFDRVFDTATRQDEIFDWGVKGIVEGELRRFGA